MQACRTGDSETVKELLEAGMAYPDVKDEKGCSSLYQACVSGHLSIAMMLLDNGADIDALSDQMVSALSATYFAARMHDGKIKPTDADAKYVEHFSSDRL